MAYRRFFFDGQAVGKFEIGVATGDSYLGGLSRIQAASLIRHVLSMAVTVRGTSSKAVCGGSNEPVISELGEAGKHIARLYAGSTMLHPPPVQLHDWWVQAGAPLVVLVQTHAERIPIPFRGLPVPTSNYSSWYELVHCQVPYRETGLRMWVITLDRYRRYREARALKICLMRLHAEHESLRLVLRNIATRKIQPPARSNASQSLQRYLNEATRRISGLDSEGNRLVASPEFAELARDSEEFINPGEREALLDCLRNVDVRQNIFEKIRRYVDTTIEINQLNVREIKIDMGDKFQNIHHATIVNRSLVQNAFNRVNSEYDEETAKALKLVADEIEKSNNSEAAEVFNSFTEELQKPEPKKPVLRSLWNGIIAVLPTILQMTDAVSKVSKLFSS